MKKIITLMLVLALAGTMGTTAVFAAPVDDSVNTNDAGTARIVPEDDSYSKTDIEKILLRDGSDDENQTDKVLLKVNTYGDGQIAVTSDGMEPVFNDAAPLQSVAMNVDKGAAAKLKAKANEGYKFMYWYDEDNETIYSIEDTIEVEMNEPLNLIAYFEEDAEKVLLKAKTLGEGLVSGSQDGTEPGFEEGNIYGDSVALNVIKGETAKLKAQPKEGYIFVCWANEDTNEIISLEDTIEVTMDEPLNLIAAFDVAGERHRVNVNLGEGSGQLAYTEDGSEPEFDEYHTTSLALSVLEGRTVNLKAKADEGYRFAFWYDEDKKEVIGNEDTLSVEVTEEMNIKAYFDLDVDRVQLEITTEGNGQITGNEGEDDPQFDDDMPFQSLYLSVIPGNTVYLKAKADEGYKFVGWKDADGKTVSTDAAYSVEVNEAMKLVAVFEPIENNNDSSDKKDADDKKGDSDNTNSGNGSGTASDSNNTNSTAGSDTGAPTTGDATCAAALAAVTLASLGAAVMLGKKRRKHE